jgi:hypothetical protein
MSAMLVSATRQLVTPPLDFFAGLSVKGWAGVVLLSSIAYLRMISQLANPRRSKPCPPFGLVFRILYGLFGTQLAEYVLSYALHTNKDEEQASQMGGTVAITHGEKTMRVKLVPILGEAFGGNYSFLIWDDDDPKKRAIVIDPADPHPVLRAARAEGLQVELLLCTHWHFDHSSGNRTFARALPGLEVVASAHELGRTPAVTRRLRDEEEMTFGRLTVRGHSVPGHTKGSMVYEIFSRAAPLGTPSCAFTGDALFCGGERGGPTSPHRSTRPPSCRPPCCRTRATAILSPLLSPRAALFFDVRACVCRLRGALRMLSAHHAQLAADPHSATHARDAPLPGPRVHRDAPQDGSTARAGQRICQTQATAGADRARTAGADAAVDDEGGAGVQCAPAR